MSKQRTAKGNGTVREKRPGYWEGRLTVGYDETGKQVQKSITGKTEKEVIIKMAQANAKIVTGKYVEPSTMRLVDWFTIWEAEYTGSIKETTKKMYARMMKTYILPVIGKVGLNRITPYNIQKLINDLSKDLAPKTVKNIHGILHKCLSKAVQIGYLEVNPCDNTELPKTIKPEMKTLDKSMIPLFLQAVEGDYYGDFFKFLLFTGMRVSEAVGLTWDCIDFHRGSITIYRQLLIKEQQFDTTKNGKTRVIVPAPFIMDILKAEKQKQEKHRIIAGDAWQNKDGFIFTHEDGTHYYQNTISRHLKQSIADTGLPDLRIHDLRHSYAVLSIQAGDDFKTISENMGHFSVAFTMDIYANVTDNMKRESANKMQSLLNSL